MRASLRHEDHSSIFGIQFGSKPFTKSLGSRPQIEMHVKHRASCAANQFGLGCRSQLKVHTAKGSLLSTKSHVGLDRQEIDAVFRKFSCAPGAHEPATVIPVRARVYDLCSAQAGLTEVHYFRPSLFRNLTKAKRTARAGCCCRIAL